MSSTYVSKNKLSYLNSNKNSVNLKLNSNKSILPFNVGLKVTNALKKTTISYLSLFLNFRLNLFKSSLNTKKYLLKKIIFSFLKPNQAKRMIMNRRKKISITRFHKKLLKVDYSSNFDRLINSKNTVFNSNQACITKNTKSFLRSYSYSIPSLREVFIPRVKFKPGYQRL